MTEPNGDEGRAELSDDERRLTQLLIERFGPRARPRLRRGDTSPESEAQDPEPEP